MMLSTPAVVWGDRGAGLSGLVAASVSCWVDESFADGVGADGRFKHAGPAVEWPSASSQFDHI